MTRHPSLSLRLGLRLGVLVSLLWLVAAAGALFVMRAEMDEVFDNSLRETARRILPLAVTQVQNHETAGQVRVPPASHHEDAMVYVLRDDAGTVVLQSRGVRPGVFADRPQTGLRSGGGYRFYGIATLQGRYVLEIAEPLAERDEALLDAGMLLLVPLAGAIPVSILLTWLIVRRMLRPLTRISRVMEARAATDTSPLPSLGMPGEIVPMIEAFNDMLDRASTAMEAERSFVSNSAHELRTPLAGALAQTQRLIAEATDPALKSRATEIEAALRRLIRMSEKLLQLARAEGSRLLADAPADLAPLVAMVVQETAGDAAAARIQVSIGNGMLVSSLDPDAFAIVLRNLIDNAILHGDPDGEILIAADAPGELCVRNAGPAVPPDRLAGLTARFERAGATATGSGLGLTIVATILSRSGGQLRLNSPVPGQPDGFEARVGLPGNPQRPDRPGAPVNG